MRHRKPLLKARRLQGASSNPVPWKRGGGLEEGGGSWGWAGGWRAAQVVTTAIAGHRRKASGGESKDELQ